MLHALLLNAALLAAAPGDTGAHKPSIAVHFAPGASSAQLHGNASRDSDDAYTFDAEKGQQLTIDRVSSRGSIAFTLFAPHGPSSMSDGVPVTLPATGAYVLRVRPAAERAAPYSFRLAIANAVAFVETPEPVPANALMRWALSIPEVRCVPFAFGLWSNTRTGKDTSGVPATLISGAKFADNLFSASRNLTLVAGVRGGSGDRYYLGRVPSSGAAVMGLDGVGNEDTFTAVIAGTTAPPRAVAALPSAPHAGRAIGLGSTRAAVERTLGAGRAKSACGFDVVHYTQSEPRGSVAELWLFYRNGVVTAITQASGA